MPFNVWNLDELRWESLTSFPTKAAAAAWGKEEMGERPYEVRKIGAVLEEHGTKLMQLKPSMIWRCAMDDLDRRRHNAQAGVGDMKHYAFHRRHVLKAESANDILRAAIADPGIGLASGKRDTRLLYSDVDLLRAALQ